MKFNRIIIIAAICLAFVASAFAQDEAKTPTYVGSGKCKMCHKGEKNGNIWETWLETPHAKAMSKLDPAKGEDKNPECLACHTTGYGAGGYDAMAEMMGAEDLGGVGCESCHGPGSEYKSKKVMESREASIAAGLWIPDENTCKKCHNEKSPTFKGFNYEEAYAKIVHHLPPKAEGGAAEGE
ncbi:MAG: cytochrome c family protein [Calditrichaeota bacterium]|nr:cytochrome c family protein [Calditrichota bacterium]MCB9367065.1 cytochrome c family protein [Calditrichota bacterium]MCB9391451.1 cytochrome c family protein [Calditrichota bacterium]